MSDRLTPYRRARRQLKSARGFVFGPGHDRWKTANASGTPLQNALGLLMFARSWVEDGTVVLLLSRAVRKTSDRIRRGETR